MTTMTTYTRQIAAGHYRLRHVVRMEWIKLRSLRSTCWTFGVSGVCAIGFGVVVGLDTKNSAGDLTNNALSGVIVGLLLVGVLGVLTATNEFTSGLIQSTLAASPRRLLLVAAKTVVFGSTALAVGEATAFLSFFVGRAALRHGIAGPALGQPGVLRAILFSGASFCLIGLLGLGLGLIIRHTAAAVAVLVGGVYVIAQMIGAFATRIDAYMPILIVANSLSTTKPLTCGTRHATQCRAFLSPTDGLMLLCLYAAVALAVGGWMLAHRDA